MKTTKAVVVALAAAVLASGGGLAGSIATAAPAHAATQGAVTQPAGVSSPPTNLQAYPNNNNGASLTWKAPTNVFGMITSYTVTIKQAGKADRILMHPASSGTWMTIDKLTASTAYVIQVKANIATGPGPATFSSPVASVNLQTPYPLTAVKAVAPTVALSGVTNTGMTAVWKRPAGSVGIVSSYDLVLKSGTTVIKRVNVPDWSDNNWAGDNIFHTAGLKAKTAYTLEVTANAKAYTGGKQAVSAKTTVKFVTAATASSVKVSNPVLAVSKVTATGAYVGWKKPTVTGGTVVSYGITVTERSTGAKKSYNIVGVNTGFTMDALKANTAYNVEVVAKAVSADKKKTTYSVTQATFTTKAK